MAVSKRMRYEVLRRDNHTCRYCGCCWNKVNEMVDATRDIVEADEEPF